MQKPLVTLINGSAPLARGLSLAIAGDIAIAARSAHFTAAYGALGRSPPTGTSWRLPRLVGMRRAQDIILTNRRIPSDEAAAIGLITRVVEDDQLDAVGAEVGAQLANAPTAALGAARNLLLGTFESELEAQLEREARASRRSADRRRPEPASPPFSSAAAPNPERIVEMVEAYIVEVLSRCRTTNAKCRRLGNCQAASTAVRHVLIAAARSTRCVWADVRWRWTLKVL